MQAICVVVKAEGLAFRSSIVVDLVRIANRKMHWREKGFLYIFFPFGLWPQAKSLESHVPTVFENQGKSLIASKASYDFTQITDTLFSIAEKKNNNFGRENSNATFLSNFYTVCIAMDSIFRYRTQLQQQQQMELETGGETKFGKGICQLWLWKDVFVEGFNFLFILEFIFTNQ